MTNTNLITSTDQQKNTYIALIDLHGGNGVQEYRVASIDDGLEFAESYGERAKWVKIIDEDGDIVAYRIQAVCGGEWYDAEF